LAEAARVTAGSLRALRRWPYRIAQLGRALRTAVTPEDARAIGALLSAAELQLFLAMRPRDRRHAVETMRLARRAASEAGAVPSNDLLVAALMHDVGKGTLRVEDRVLYVILRAVSLRLVDRLAREPGALAVSSAHWRQALWRLRHHAALGAALLHAAGSHPRVIELTAIHHDPPASDDRELHWLLVADEAA